MMSEDRFGWQVRQLLNKSTQDISPAAQSRLEKARQLAVSRKRQTSSQWAFNIVPRMAMAGMGGSSGIQNKSDPAAWLSNMIGVLPAIALALGIAIVADNQQTNRAMELAEIDSAVLADDLPLSAYLDQGFSMYVNHRPAPSKDEAAPAVNTLAPEGEASRI